MIRSGQLPRRKLPAFSMQIRRWAESLLEPVDAASTGVFRIVFGSMVAWDALRYLHYGWVEEYYVAPKLHFTYLYLDFVRPLPGGWMIALFWGLAALGFLIAFGLFYRVAIVLFFLAYTYVFLLEQSVYMNHYYLIVLLSFLLSWIPAHHAFSLDRRRRPVLPQTIPRWSILVLRFQLFVVYFYGAIAKLNADWLAGEPMYSEIVRRGPDVPPIAAHFPPAVLAHAIAYGGILVDLVIPLSLCFRRTRKLGFAIAFVFHLLNEIFLRIGIFSYLMVGAITIFFDPDWPRRWRTARRAGTSPGAPATPRLRGRTAVGLAALHLYVLFQLLFPLRHWLFPGPVGWTEEGHRFAWHMKLRKKRSEMTIHVLDPTTGHRWTIDPTADLQPRQLRKLHTFPDILLQYVHYVAERLRAEGIQKPVITVDWQCSLNGAPDAPLVDPTVNLAEVERTWRPAPWILRERR